MTTKRGAYRTRRASGSAASPARPRQWSTAVAVAAMRIAGGSQKECAKAAGVSERSVRAWESSSWWPAAKAEATTAYLDELQSFARRALLQAVRRGNAKLALDVLERTMPELAPPRIRATVGHVDYDTLADAELARIAAGEDPAIVLADRGKP